MKQPIIRTGRDSIVSSRVALRAFLAVVAVSAVLGLLVIMNVVTDTRFLATSAIVAVGCMATFVCALVADHGRFSRWMRSATVVGWLGVLVWLFLVWFEAALGSKGMEITARIAGALSLYAVWSIFSAVTLAPRGGGTITAIVRWSVFVLAAWWSAFGEFALAEPDIAEMVAKILGEQWFGRIVGASAIVIAAGALAQPVLIRIAGAAPQESAIRGRRAKVALGCPRCGTQCELETNTDAKCAACQLAIRVEVDEPRCACGYLLFGLETTTCPECGAAVPESLHWKGAPVRSSQA
ncbi:MAG: zinc ribbon domain-containing protein [Planctomycetota bacterium]